MFGTSGHRRALLLLPLLSLLLASAAVASGPADAVAPTSAPASGDGSGWSSDGSWTEQFDGPAGTAPDPARWGHDVGGGGWGNGESQTYTDRTDNAQLTGRGSLLIQARGETYTGPDDVTRDYTSARLVSKDSFLYGTITAKIKLTGMQGAWPAFWTLGANKAEVGWPKCGELDVLEALNDFPKVIGSVHGPQTYGPDWQAYGHGGELSPPGGLGNGWHTYGVRWSKTAITWLLDGAAYRTVKRADLPKTDIWAMSTPQNLLLNVAVGGWAGTPAPPADFRASMEVAWVKAVPLATT